jgi:hypothetical protein
LHQFPSFFLYPGNLTENFLQIRILPARRKTQLEREFSHCIKFYVIFVLWFLSSCGRKSVIEALSVVRRLYNKQIIYWARRLQQVAAAAASLDAAGDVLYINSNSGALR